VKEFKATHNNTLPQNEAEKQAFQKQILDKGKFLECFMFVTFGRLISILGREYQHAHNFQEARDNAYLCYIPYSIPSEVSDILNDEKCNLTADSPTYWILARAVKDFIAKEGQGMFRFLFQKLFLCVFWLLVDSALLTRR
jgi:amyloid beta precursor protein binding protein 1